MPTPANNFNWKNSAAHFSLLRAFEKPRAISQVLSWDWPRQSLQEKTEIAIQRFIQEGLLVPTTLEEALNKLLQVAQLKKLMNERNLPTAGSKSELIERL